MTKSNIIIFRDYHKRNIEKIGRMPMDFYSFRQRTFTAPGGFEAPHWIVGHSPFDSQLSGDEGHVVHIGVPSFVARWSYQEDRIAPAEGARHWLDEDLGLLIYEVCWIEAEPKDWSRWLLEACCAVAYTKGDIAESFAGEGTA